jgi:outer membrane protein TolC
MANLLNFAHLEKRIRAQNPDLSISEASIRANEKNRALVYKNRYPDFSLGIMPTQVDHSVDEWGVMLEINIPLQQSIRRDQEREAEAMLEAARAEKAAVTNRVLSQLVEHLSGIEAAKQTEALGVNSLLPETQITFESALVGYQTGKIDFATLLDAAKQILMAKREVLKAKVDAEMRLAQIERLLGEDL